MPNTAEIIERSVKDFSRVQRRMLIAKKENAMEMYADLREEYIDLKAILTSLGVNVTELDRIKE